MKLLENELEILATQQREWEKNVASIQHLAETVVVECANHVETLEERFRLLKGHGESLLRASENDTSGLYRLTKHGGETWECAANYSTFVEGQFATLKEVIFRTVETMREKLSSTCG